MASARVDINDDDFKANGKATWSLKNKTYDPAILRELEMEVIDESELRRPVLVNPISSSSAVAPSTSESKENVEPSKPVAKKARELEAAGYCVIRHVPDRPLTKVRYMDQFGDEMILMIFEWLPKNVLACCARVCKRWRRLAYDESLWVHIDLGGKKMESGVANHLLSRGLSVVRFNSTEFESPVMVPMQGPLNHVRMTASKLTLLDLSYATITANDLADLLSSCQSLKKLSLETLEISEAVCSAIGKNSQLTTLNLCMCTGVTNMCMLKIFRGCPLLDELNLGWTDLKEDVVAVTLAMAKGLVRLNISGYRGEFGDHPVRVVCNRCPRLISLDVSDCILISDKGLKIIVDSLPQLEELFFSRCLHLTIRGVREIKRLKRLKNGQAFSVITDDGFMREMTAALPGAMINKTFFSTIARPTVGIRRTSIWGHRTR